jgi:dTDP-glucose pyrophosphorylase
MTTAQFESVLVQEQLPIIEAVKIMNKSSMQILLVVNDQRHLIGVVTDGDIRRALIENRDFNEAVRSIMSTQAITMPVNVGKEQALRLMKDRGINHLPLVDDQGRIAGLLLWKDFFSNGDLPVRSKNNLVVIMAGGKGTRLELFTRIFPKPLIPIGEKPIIEHIMENFHKYGFSRFLLSLNYKAEMIRLYFSELNPQNFEIDYIQETEFLGTAGALALGRDRFQDTIMVSNCDVLIDADLDSLFQYHRDNRNKATILGMVRDIKIPYGVLKADKADLETIIEKPEYHFVINSGIYVLEPEVIDLISPGQACDMPDLLIRAKEKGLKTQIYPMTCSWFDVGQWGEYQQAVEHMSSLGLIN